MKKAPGDIIILQICTKNDDHMMYGSWDMVRDGWTDGHKKGHNFFISLVSVDNLWNFFSQFTKPPKPARETIYSILTAWDIAFLFETDTFKKVWKFFV